MSDSQHSHPPYKVIFGVLCLFTALSWLADEAKQRGWMTNTTLVITVVLAIATAKALCVLMYFMHIKFEGRWILLLLAPTTILAIGLPLALLPDIGLHYYMPTSPQATVAEEAKREAAEARSVPPAETVPNEG